MQSFRSNSRFWRAWKFYWAPILVLVLSLLATALVAKLVAVTAAARDHARFKTTMTWTQLMIQERLSIYRSVLDGGAALLSVVECPTVAEFRAYAARLSVQLTFPGIQGVGFARRTLPEERTNLVATLRLQGHSDFEIRPPGDREEYFPIIYLEPLDRRNAHAIGYDMFSEPIRHEAMAQARDEGSPVASAKVRLVQEIDPVKQPGFLIYVPVYRGGEVPPTVEERRQRLLGFIYSPFRAYDLFAGIFGADPRLAVHLDVYDGSEVAPERLLYSSAQQPADRPGFNDTSVLGFAKRNWTLRFRSTPEFEQASYRLLVPWVMILGTLISLALCTITAALARAHRDVQRAQAELRDHAESLESTVAQRTSKLREVVSELEHMSYSIVHDMRAPLRAIQSFGAILAEEAGPALTPACHDYLTRMRTAAARMDALIRDVLSYAKMVRCDYPLYPVEVPPLVKSIIETYPSLQSAQADIEVAQNIPPVLGNEAALTQCFANLLTNAVKFVKPGQRPKVSVTGERSNGGVSICVTDNGIGIPEEFEEKVFGMFQRLGNSYEGTGMGLAIVRKAAERMGGTVSLEPGEHEGTRFILKLRSAPGQPPLVNPK